MQIDLQGQKMFCAFGRHVEVATCENAIRLCWRWPMARGDVFPPRSRRESSIHGGVDFRIRKHALYSAKRR